MEFLLYQLFRQKVQLNPRWVQTERETTMTELIVAARGKQEAGSWSEDMKKRGKRWDLVDQWLTECDLFHRGILSGQPTWMMVEDVGENEIKVDGEE